MIRKIPAALAVPLICPVAEFKVNPLGSAPPVMLHVSGGTPPVAVSGAVYGVPTCAGGKDDVVITSSGATWIEQARSALAPLWSDTRSANVAEPALAGTPETMPESDAIVSPVGKLPDETPHVYGACPPSAVTVASYGLPTVAITVGHDGIARPVTTAIVYVRDAAPPEPSVTRSAAV